MAVPTVYKSTDGSAPVLDGQAGSFVNLLDKCLVAGYGSKSAAGWSKPYTATNKAVFLQGAASGVDSYLDVDDSGAGAATTQEANVRGYEAMTAVATGTNPFPTTAQVASPGMYIRKSAAATSTARAWVVIADEKTFYLFILSGDSAGLYQTFGFGDFYSFKPSDAWRAVILGANASGANVNAGLNLSSLAASQASAVAGAYAPRNLAAAAGSSPLSLLGLGTAWTTVGTGPNPPDGNIFLNRLTMGENAANGLRGYLRGLYQIVTASGLNDGDTFSGATGTDFAGRTFLVLNKTRNGAYLALETTAWDTSS